MENPFSERMSELPDLELFKIVRQKEEYQELAVEAAKNEIKNRELSVEKINAIIKELETIELKKEEKKKIINESVKQFVNFIKNRFIPIPSNKKSPAPYINSLAILLIAALLGNYVPMIYYSIIFEDYSSALVYFGLLLIFSTIAVSLLNKKKFGWVTLIFFMTLYLSRNILVFYFDWFVYSLPEGSNTVFVFLYDSAIIIFPYIIIRYLNKPLVRVYFKISYVTQNITLFVSIFAGAAYFIIWAFFLPEYFNL